MEKMETKKATEVRAEVYSVIASALAEKGYDSEPVKGGRLVDLGDGYFGKVSFSVCDATKFDLEATRTEYAEALAKQAEKAEKAREKAMEKEAKAKEKASKALEKTAE